MGGENELVEAVSISKIWLLGYQRPIGGKSQVTGESELIDHNNDNWTWGFKTLHEYLSTAKGTRTSRDSSAGTKCLST